MRQVDVDDAGLHTRETTRDVYFEDVAHACRRDQDPADDRRGAAGQSGARSLHAKVRIAAHDRDGLERLCRYVARPPFRADRLSLDDHGRVVYALRRHWRDGTSAVVFEPLDFIARLAALVPRPRAHLLTYHGVLAPAAAWRDHIVPGASAEKSASTPSASSGADCDGHPSRKPVRPTRHPWADLMKRVFEFDVLVCPYCEGQRKLIAFLTDGSVVRKILLHLGLDSEPPHQAPARALEEGAFAW
jgi:hypothetical protein